MDMKTDMYMDLKITDINELEQDLEYYVIYCHRDMLQFNGIYTLCNKRINIFGEIGNLINTVNNTKFNLHYVVSSLSWCCKFMILTSKGYFECSLFKMPTNEYVLK
jgi:hypothetical protein